MKIAVQEHTIVQRVVLPTPHDRPRRHVSAPAGLSATLGSASIDERRGRPARLNPSVRAQCRRAADPAALFSAASAPAKISAGDAHEGVSLRDNRPVRESAIIDSQVRFPVEVQQPTRNAGCFSTARAPDLHSPQLRP
jgi:hypothetical protein